MKKVVFANLYYKLESIQYESYRKKTLFHWKEMTNYNFTNIHESRFIFLAKHLSKYISKE